MLKDETLRDLPEDAEQAFLSLEKDFREACEFSLIDAQESYAAEVIYKKYINHTVAAADALGISDVIAWHSDSRSVWDDYAALTQIIDAIRVRVSIQTARRDRRYSVPLNEAERAKIIALVSQIRQELEVLELDLEKREALLNKLAAFESELSRPRTRLAVFAALYISVSAAAENASESLVRKIERIGKALGIAKDRDKDHPALPAPDEIKKLDPPPRRLPAPKRPRIDDDEIPF